MKKGFMIFIGLTAAILIAGASVVTMAAEQSPTWPVPSVRDQIIHDRGNISTAVQNFGYIGDAYGAGLPSGRWPAGTTHDYLAEMRFWIGGINADGDTLVINTSDDINPIINIGVGTNDYEILVSTDTTRYMYDPADTVGSGIGFPANGWRIWDVDTDSWVYNDVYSVIDDDFFPGGPVSVQESICRYGDDASGSPVMGLEITQTIRQWNYQYNRDMIFITLEIENASTEDYSDVAIGVYCDFDIGGLDPATGENGRLGDLVACDTALNLAWTYDEDGYDPGWGPSTVTGLMGTVILSTPNDIGMTAFNTDQWELLPTSDRGRYAIIDNTEFDASLPPTDQYYVQSVRGIDLPAGTAVTIDFAIVAAPNETYLKQVAARARALYENNYIGPKPPDPSVLTATSGDGMVTLMWDNTAEEAIEPTTGEQDFKGYKVYRSSDRGATWGTYVVNPDLSTGPDFYPIGRYEPDGFGRIAHTFVDSNLTNGIEYWYSVVAYDTGAPAFSIDTLQNDRGTPTSAANTAKAVPRDDALGYISPQASLTHTYDGAWRAAPDNAVTVYAVDEGDLSGDDYQVTLNEDCLDVTWNLINTTTGDTVLANQTQVEGLASTYPIADGMQVVVKVPTVMQHYLPEDAYQSAFAMAGDPTFVPLFVEKFYPEDNCHDLFRNDIEIRFTATGSVGYDYLALFYYSTIVAVDLPFEVWNVTADSQLSVWIADWSLDGEWTIAEGDWIIMTNYGYDDGNEHSEALPDYFTWVLEPDVSSAPVDGDIFTITGPRVVSPDDDFTFSSGKISSAQARASFDNIHVVPNPYLGYAKWEDGRGSNKIQFVNLPDQCTIYVYTLAGELIQTIDHTDGTGAEDWNMLSASGKGISAGVYLYHVESTYGNKTGKFAVVK